MAPSRHTFFFAPGNGFPPLQPEFGHTEVIKRLLFQKPQHRTLQASVLCALVTLGATNSCADHVLQTATEEGDSFHGTGGLVASEGGASNFEVECGQAASSPVALDTSADTVAKWPFVSGDYGVSQGPGIAVAARDSFRLYVNGKLLHEDLGFRKPVFVPVLLPPGDNVVVLAVAASSGTPAALIHIDELAETITSDEGWKYALDPEGNWESLDFDDSFFRPAVELANYGAASACDPTSDFPAHSDARWIGPALGETGSLVLRRELRIAPTGFGAEARGGEGAEPVVVNNWVDLEMHAEGDEPKMLLIPEGVHDFRRMGEDISNQEVCPRVCANDNTKIRYEVLLGDEVCPDPTVQIPRDDRILRLGSNTTIVGLGRGAALRGVTLDFQESEHIIVRNIAIFDVNPEMIEGGDAFSLTAPKHVWIDHGTTQGISDGFTDLRAGSSNVTISFMRYDGRTAQECEDRHTRASMIDRSEATIHHSRFDHISQNAPVVLGASARVHLFNNSYSNVSGWVIGAACGAVVFAEGNTFENVDAIATTSDCGADTGLGFLSFPTGSNAYRDGSPSFLGGDGTEPQYSQFSPPYEYEAQLASDAWPLVISRAGAGGPWALPLSLD